MPEELESAVEVLEVLGVPSSSLDIEMPILPPSQSTCTLSQESRLGLTLVYIVL